MYQQYFGLNNKPFAITPNPRFHYLNEQQRSGLTHLLYGADEAGSFVLLTGEPGTGKTILCRSLKKRAPRTINFALVLNPSKTPLELLSSICDQFVIPYPTDNTSEKLLMDKLKKYLLLQQRKGCQSIVAIDEAQNLNLATLEQVRLLTNLETRTRKLLKIILVGQPELTAILSMPETQALSQRITARYPLEPLSLKETAAYIQHRLKVAGAEKKIFQPGAIKELHRASKGIPRMINLISERSLTGAYAMNRKKVDQKLISAAAKEILGSSPKSTTPNRFNKLLLASTLLAMTAGLIFFYSSKNEFLFSSSNKIKTTAPAKIIDKPEPPIVKSALLEKLNKADTGSLALKQLFKIWGYDFDSLKGGSTCQRAKQAGLGCRFTNGSIDDIQRYNRPAVLELKDASNQGHQILLSSINQDNIVLRLSSGEQAFDRSDIEANWSGNYLVLWQLPPQGSTFLKLGKSGPDIIWLRQRLNLLGDNQLAGQEDTNIFNDVFDESLKQRVINFQRKSNLKADGLVGEETLVLLATAISPEGTPVLLSSGATQNIE
jgi:general secretion pathway protein A